MEERYAEVPFEVYEEITIPKTLRGGLQVTEHDIQVDLRTRINNMDANHWDTDSQLYPILCELIQAGLDLGYSRLPAAHNSPMHGMQVKDTSMLKDLDEADGVQDLIPDLCIYRKYAPNEQTPYDLDTEEGKKLSIRDEKRKPWAGRVDWLRAKLFVQVKSQSDSPFPSHPCSPGTSTMTLPTGGKAQTIREDITQYAAEIRLQQHRLFVLAVLFSARTVRFMRWDVVGAIVSEPIDLSTDLLKVFRFFCLLGQMSDVELGWDPTVQPASDAEVALWQSAFLKSPLYHNERLRKRYGEVFDHEDRCYKVTVNGDDLATAQQRWSARDKPQSIPPSQPREVLIGLHSSGHRSPTGRATRGFVAYDLRDKAFYYLKDSWRPDYSKDEDLSTAASDPEIITLATLHDHLEPDCIKFIPEVVCGGDMVNVVGTGDVHSTISDQHLARGHHPRIHTRLVLRQVGLPLEDYLDSYELVTILYDALSAHMQAWERADILHRDISDGNIIIDVTTDPDESIGRLIDWDLSKRKDQLNKGAAQKDRSGTWPFLSAAIVNDPNKPYELSDDIESFVHLLFWEVKRFHRHSLSGQTKQSSLLSHVRSRYLHCEIDPKNKTQSGCVEKLADMRSGILGSSIELNKNSNSAGLRILVKSLLDLCQRHYAEIDWVLPTTGNEDVLVRKALERTRFPKHIRKAPGPFMDQLSEVKAMILQEDRTKQGTSTKRFAPVSDEKLPLRNHKAISNSFFYVISQLTDSEDGVWFEDKVEDQFNSPPSPLRSSSTKRMTASSDSV